MFIHMVYWCFSSTLYLFAPIRLPYSSATNGNLLPRPAQHTTMRFAPNQFPNSQLHQTFLELVSCPQRGPWPPWPLPPWEGYDCRAVGPACCRLPRWGLGLLGPLSAGAARTVRACGGGGTARGARGRGMGWGTYPSYIANSTSSTIAKYTFCLSKGKIACRKSNFEKKTKNSHSKNKLAQHMVLAES